MTEQQELLQRIKALDSNVNKLLELFVNQQKEYADIEKKIETKICDVVGVADVRQARELFSFLSGFKINSCRAVTVTISAAVTGIVAGIIGLFVAGFNANYK